MQQHKNEQQNKEQPSSVSQHMSQEPVAASPPSPAKGAGEVDTGDGKQKAAEAQRRWEEALKNDPKRAEQMEYRARLAAGPALAGSEQDTGGTAAENKFCVGIAGEHAVFDGKEGGCRCKRGYKEDDDGKCVADSRHREPGSSSFNDESGGMRKQAEALEATDAGSENHQSLGALAGESLRGPGSLRGWQDEAESLGGFGDASIAHLEGEASSLGGFEDASQGLMAGLGESVAGATGLGGLDQTQGLGGFGHDGHMLGGLDSAFEEGQSLGGLEDGQSLGGLRDLRDDASLGGLT